MASSVKKCIQGQDEDKILDMNEIQESSRAHSQAYPGTQNFWVKLITAEDDLNPAITIHMCLSKTHGSGVGRTEEMLDSLFHKVKGMIMQAYHNEPELPAAMPDGEEGMVPSYAPSGMDVKEEGWHIVSRNRLKASFLV